MKKKKKTNYPLKIFWIFIITAIFGGWSTCNAQATALMPSDGYWYTWTVDDGLLYDDGYLGNYKNNGLGALTVYPTVGYTSFEFITFDVEFEPSVCGWDYLEVYHGETFDSLIGRYCGLTLPPIIKSTDPSGALTLLWSSDFSVSRSGFIISIQTIGGALPIELISFTGNPNRLGVELEFTVACEVNNDYFTIEKSRDAYRWNEFIRIEGMGNHNNIVTYSCYDELPYIGLSYYRLKQTDYNGDCEYFNPISVVLELDRYLIKTINMQGQEVDEKYKGVVIDIYSDGVNNKRIQE